MRKDGAKEFLQRPENRVQIVFLYQKLVHVSEICVNHSYARQILSKKAKRRRCVFACAVWSHVDGKVFVSGKTANNRQQMCFCTVCRSVREKSMYGTKCCLFK